MICCNSFDLKIQVQTYWLEGANEKAIQRRTVDLGELPPLFCRPHRSPKLTVSRQASIYGMTGKLYFFRLDKVD